MDNGTIFRVFSTITGIKHCYSRKNKPNSVNGFWFHVIYLCRDPKAVEILGEPAVEAVDTRKEQDVQQSKDTLHDQLEK